MLPYLAAAGHNLYTKSAYLYLQTMNNLPLSRPDVYNSFLEGHHVVRRSDRYWGGLSSDLTIEQILTKAAKRSGGLTRGRGITEAQRAKWVLARPTCAQMNSAMQDLTGNRKNTRDQHLEMRATRWSKDSKYSTTAISYLQERNPFFRGGPRSS